MTLQEINADMAQRIRWAITHAPIATGLEHARCTDPIERPDVRAYSFEVYSLALDFTVTIEAHDPR